MYALMSEVCAIAALLAVYEAYQYQSIGHGLNPLVAMPVATLLILLPYAFVRRV